MKNIPCHCGSGRNFSECCGPLLLRIRKAKTAEELMRSRYSAYVEENETYLLDTWHASTRPAGLDLAKRNGEEWLPLKVLAATEGKETASVEFSTGYREEGTVAFLHETSRFTKERGEWFYLNGIFHRTPADEKVGRNDPCPCGSGKKYKKCCG